MKKNNNKFIEKTYGLKGTYRGKFIILNEYVGNNKNFLAKCPPQEVIKRTTK